MRQALSTLFSGKQPNQTERRLLARAHPAYFAWIYLRGDDGSTITPTPFHLEWYGLFIDQLAGRRRHLCIVAPKSHAKSTILTKVIPLYVTCVLDPNARVVKGAVNAELAERFFRANRRELEANQLLIEDFGPFKPESPEKWTQTELIVRRESSSPSPTWRAVGSGAPVQGGRSDWVLGDDLADLENSRTQLQRDRLQEWFDGDVMGTLEPTGADGSGGGHAIVVGTPKHNDDLYSRLKRKAAEPNSGWTYRHYDAIVDEEKQIALWPARWSWNALQAKKSDVGSVTFNRDYRGVAVNDETSLFPMELLNRAKRTDLVMTESYGAASGESDAVYAAIDLAIVEDERQAQKSDSDYTVMLVWRRMSNGARRLLWGYRKRGLGMTPQITLAETTLRRYPALKIAIVEANQAQRWFASTLLAAAKGDLPIKKHVTGKNAHVDLYEGVPSLSALFEANMVELPYGDEASRAFTDLLVNELHGLGVETHDDMVMSFWLSEIGLRKLSTSFTFGKAKNK